MRKWWRIGLSGREIEAIQSEARALCDVNGTGARCLVLDRARRLGRRHWREAARLSQLAGCMEDELKGLPNKKT